MQKNRQNRKKSEVFTVFGAVSPKLGPVCFFLWGRICHILTRVGLAAILSINGHGLEGNWRFERGLRCYFQALFTFLPDSDLLRGRMWMVSGHILHQKVSTVVLKKFSLRFRSYLSLRRVMIPTFRRKTVIFVDFWSIID